MNRVVCVHSCSTVTIFRKILTSSRHMPIILVNSNLLQSKIPYIEGGGGGYTFGQVKSGTI